MAETTTLIRTALARYPLDDEHPWMLVVDLDYLAERFSKLCETFPAQWLHAAAVKAHPLQCSLELLARQGAGLEAASIGELELAVQAGCPPGRIVFDSPVKTVSEIRRALELGATINCDNLSELRRVASLYSHIDTQSRIGVRINPEVAAGRIEQLSVGTRDSKFGVSLEREGDEVRGAFAQHPWLTGIHSHVGSQGYAVELLAAGARRVVDFALSVEAQWVDIGGGMPVRSHGEETVPSMQDYADRLRSDVPELFDGQLDVITEFGRWLFTHAALAVSRIEYVKPAATTTIATIHFGADLMLRHIYQPNTWHHPMMVLTPEGEPKSGPTASVTVGGPLCFGSDILVRDALLPAVEEGDLFSVENLGAYTFSMWSRYCSRRLPRVVGIRGESAEIVAGPETADDITAFWAGRG